MKGPGLREAIWKKKKKDLDFIFIFWRGGVHVWMNTFKGDIFILCLDFFRSGEGEIAEFQQKKINFSV